MSLRGRLKARLRGIVAQTPAAPRAERAFDPRTAAIWAEQAESYAHAWQAIGASVTASWEVAAAELNRGLRGDPDRTALVERFSDALVPTIEPLREADHAAHRVFSTAIAGATAAGRLDAAFPPLVAPTRAIGAAVDAGWGRTVDWLAPVIAARAVDPAGVDRLVGIGARLRMGFDARGAAFERALATVARADDVERAFTDALEGWQHGTARDVEIALDEARAILVDTGR